SAANNLTDHIIPPNTVENGYVPEEVEYDGTFKDLENIINNASENAEIILDKNYIFTEGVDDSLINGIEINKSLTINGKGHTIDGNSTAKLFTITADNVIIKNITLARFKNETGAVINNNAENLTLSNLMVFSSHNYIHNLGTMSLENNFFANYEERMVSILNDGNITSGARVVILNNDTVVVEFGGLITLVAQLCDDRDNLIIGNQTVNITIDNKTFTALPESYYYYHNYDANKTGDFPVTGSSTGYTNLTESPAILIVRKDPNFTADVISGDLNATFNFTANPNATGNITITIGNKNYTVPLDNGSAIITIPLTAGTYSVNITYDGDEQFFAVDTGAYFEIKKINTTLVGDNIIMYYKNGTRYYFVLTDINGNPLEGMIVYLTINNATYNRTTDKNGSASIAINLNPGNYIMSVKFNGTDNYTSQNTSNTITINSVLVNGEDIIKYYKNGTQYYITLLDGQGKPLANTNVTMNINGGIYTRQTNANGTANLTINLNPGKYTITTEYNGLHYSNNITVLSIFDNGKDIVKYYKNGTQYYITLLDGQGKPLANTNVTMNINGGIYTRQTNANGTANLTINLNPGNYIITTEYNGLHYSNNIEVLTTLRGEDLNKTFGGNETYNVKVLDGKGNPLNNTNVTININGRVYNKPTDEFGIARLDINLNAGSYIATAYYNGYATSNKIEVLQK
ncbi:Ig-like domain repeat protein, partial [Methanobrevibacter sp. OttesenSCG-928-K11]|nr:Ig-like domain repeat protein [Methanobrevibacter sp. OttesenSCG-928-K11]